MRDAAVRLNIISSPDSRTKKLIRYFLEPFIKGFTQTGAISPEIECFWLSKSYSVLKLLLRNRLTFSLLHIVRGIVHTFDAVSRIALYFLKLSSLCPEKSEIKLYTSLNINVHLSVLLSSFLAETSDITIDSDLSL